MCIRESVTVTDQSHLYIYILNLTLLVTKFIQSNKSLDSFADSLTMKNNLLKIVLSEI